MTTVGYGDYSGKGNIYEETYCMIMIFFSMMLFALIQNRLMHMKRSKSLT